MHKVLLSFGLSAVACHAQPSEAAAPARTPDEPAPAPAPEPAKTHADAVPVRGKIEAIRMHNINKALDHYTYNVEIELRHEGVERAGTFDPAKIPNPLVVRVDKVFWSAMSQPERDAVAPDGPKEELQPPRWKDLAVGDTVELDVTFTSPSLAQRVR